MSKKWKFTNHKINLQTITLINLCQNKNLYHSQEIPVSQED